MAANRTPFNCSVRARGRRDGTVAFDVRFRLDGASRSASFDNQKAADKWANVLRQIGPVQALELLNLDAGATPTVSEYAERYIRGKSGVEGKTTDDYRMFMRISIGPSMGELPLDAVAADRIAAWVNDQVEEGKAAKTIKNRHGFLYAMFESAREAGLIQRNPCAKTRLPDSEQVEMVFLTHNEYTELYSYIPSRYQPVVAMLAATGMRWGEVTAIKVQDIDFENRTVRVSRAWKHSSAKGWYVGPPKTRKSRRMIPLPASVMPMLREQAALGNEYLFVNVNGEPIRQSKFYEDVWQPARRLANGLPAFEERNGNADWAPRTGGVWDRTPSVSPIGKYPRVHDLRHSHAFWLIQSGCPLIVVQQRLGHESIQTTSDTYGHVSNDMAIAAAAAIDGVLAGSMPELMSVEG